jgi:hypothetical protein
MGDTEYGRKILWQKFVFFIPHSNKCPRESSFLPISKETYILYLNVVSFHYTNNCFQEKKTYLPKCENVGRERGNKDIFKYGLICPINYIKLINLCCRKPQDIFIKYKFLQEQVLQTVNN